MDTYALLRLGHIVGAILLGGGLLAVFVSELRAWRTDDVRLFAELITAVVVALVAAALLTAALARLARRDRSAVARRCERAWRPSARAIMIRRGRTSLAGPQTERTRWTI